MATTTTNESYEGFSCRALGKIVGDIDINGYVTCRDERKNMESDTVDFYIFFFTIACDSKRVQKRISPKDGRLIIKQIETTDKYRVMLKVKNIDYCYVLKPGIVMEIHGVPRISQRMALKYNSPLYIDCHGYHVIRIPDVVDKDTGEVIKSVYSRNDLPNIKYFTRAGRRGGYVSASLDFEPFVVDSFKGGRKSKFGVTELDLEDIYEYSDNEEEEEEK